MRRRDDVSEDSEPSVTPQSVSDASTEAPGELEALEASATSTESTVSVDVYS